jgi:peptide chain release factor 2
MQEKAHVEQPIKEFDALQSALNDNVELIELGELESDQDVITEAEDALKSLVRDAQKMEITSMFSGDADGNDCFIEIHSGAGGTESCDWAEMLMRMYMRWAESRGFKYELIDENPGDETGIKGATIRISGQHAFGWAKNESGVHRLVRISPFDSASRRHTSFASVWVYPVVDDTINVELEDKDIRVDTYRASGAGGQHINKTDSAIRLTHEPTGIVVQCQNQRSQHKNRAEAMAMLKARIYEMELRKQEAETEEKNSLKTDNSWGNQIRSYVLHPYQMIKDLRTNFETGNTSAVLDGDLDGFMTASLTQKKVEK